jgi:hypothetical protein
MAVVTQQQAFCERRLVTLRSQLAVGGLDFEQLASAWANHEFEQHATREGKLYLNAVLRLHADHAEPVGTRRDERPGACVAIARPRVAQRPVHPRPRHVTGTHCLGEMSLRAPDRTVVHRSPWPDIES